MFEYLGKGVHKQHHWNEHSYAISDEAGEKEREPGFFELLSKLLYAEIQQKEREGKDCNFFNNQHKHVVSSTQYAFEIDEHIKRIGNEENCGSKNNSGHYIA